ncbi:MAG: TetR/AcrR family transcriptional regulator [Hyphomicrobiales bacterium]|nr:TetR/AcrR family transcriptional regulator [Hyphomicrobiales bacterium]MCP5000735.1 TetR/AcrR family transcriptional regulator [Hyphomicrobiales bacterium]
MAAPRTRKRAVDRKAEIVETAIRLSAEIGPDRLTTDLLAREIGISQPAIFRHFPTKGDIWLAVAQRIGEMLRQNALLSDKDVVQPIDKLRNLVVDHLAFIEQTPAIPAILFSRELHAENEHLRAFFSQLIESRQRSLARLIHAEIAVGRFNKSLNADDAAYLLLALIQGLAMRWSLNNRQFDLVAEGQRLLALQFSGFEKPAAPAKNG